jgi:glyoxylate/hydroxypyruvate reductase A
MTALLEGLESCSVLLHATSEGRGLYERLGFVRTGEIRQHQGVAQPAPLIALGPERRLRPATEADLQTLRALDTAARGMPRPALIDELFRDADATVVLDEAGRARGFAMLRRFGRGHAIGPVVAPEAEGAQALIAHLVGLNAGRFTRIDIDFDSGLGEWLEGLGLLRVDAPTAMVRGTPLARDANARPLRHRHPGARLMRPVFVYKADGQRGRKWAEIFRREAPEIDFRLWPEIGDAHAVRYLAAWVPPAGLGTQFPNLELLFSTGAGVDQFDFATLPPHLTVVRMVEPGIVQGMVEYVTHAVLDLHRDMPAYRRAQQHRQWQPIEVRTAAECRVGVLGLGSLGQAVLAQLVALGFDARAGADRATRYRACTAMPAKANWTPSLARTQILVCLLPLTDATRGLLNAALFARLPRGASLVHVGRGPQLVGADLLRALDAGQLAEAVLDVTDPEPLPESDPLWSHPRIRITPHIASMTQPHTAARVVIDNLRRHAQGEQLLGLVDRVQGY